MRNHWKGWRLGHVTEMNQTPYPLLFVCPLFHLLINFYFSDTGMGRPSSQYQSGLNTTQMDSIVFVSRVQNICCLRDF